MPANINVRNGQASVMVTSTPAWHGLGTVLQSPATAAEAIKAAKLDWDVIKQPLYAGEKEQRRIPEHFAVVRDDDWKQDRGPVLGIVGTGYTTLQNRDAFKFFDPIVGEKAAVYHTAGALGNGERVWVLAKLPGDIQVIGEDVADKYLLLSNSHDGNSAVQIKFTPIRVVCENTLTQALREGPTLRVTHTKDLKERLRVAATLLKVVQVRFGELEISFKQMARVQMNKEKLTSYFNQVFPDPRSNPDEERYARALAQARHDRGGAEYYFEKGRGNELKGAKGTLWAAYNGVAEYVDYGKFTSAGADRRLSAIWFGEGYSAKARAFAVAEKNTVGWAN